MLLLDGDVTRGALFFRERDLKKLTWGGRGIVSGDDNVWGQRSYLVVGRDEDQDQDQDKWEDIVPGRGKGRSTRTLKEGYTRLLKNSMTRKRD